MSIKNVIQKPAETIFRDAVKVWWEKKGANAARISKSQGGTRDGGLAGNTMDGFRDVIIKHLVSAGVDRGDIYAGRFSTQASNLPSYYRASKNWDVVICKNGHHKRLQDPTLGKPQLIAAIEFKSQEKSIGNNQNNRIEESIGNAHDFWASYENKNFVRLTPRPWLGYLFVGRYGEGDEDKVVKISQPLIPTDPGFSECDPKNRLEACRIKGPSYATRYKIFLERMIAKKLYDGACFIVTHEDIANSKCNYRILFTELSGESFLDGLKRHVRAYYFD